MEIITNDKEFYLVIKILIVLAKKLRYYFPHLYNMEKIEYSNNVAMI